MFCKSALQLELQNRWSYTETKEECDIIKEMWNKSFKPVYLIDGEEVERVK